MSGLAVLEGKWFVGRNLTVKSIFDFICELHFENSHAYHYEMFNSGDAFREILQRLCETDNMRHIYIAAHGSPEGIYGSNEQAISITRIKNAISSLDDIRGTMDSLYFGSCMFGEMDNLARLLVAGSKLRWMAGYNKSIEFVESTTLDALFWNKYLDCAETTALQKVTAVCEELKRDVPGLIEKLGFKVMAYDGRRAEPCVELI